MRSLFIAVALSLGVTFPVLADPPPQTVYDRLLGVRADADLSILAQRLREAFAEEDLVRFFAGDANSTVFAPTNAAFRSYLDGLSEDERESLLDPKTGALERLLRYHVTQGAWDFRSSGLPGAIRMLDDNTAHVYREGHDLKIDQAVVLQQTRLRNGVIAKISSVISPSPTLLGCSIFVSEHFNYLDFISTQFSTLNSFAMEFTGYSITDCQPWGGVSVQGDSILVKAGRHKSSTPANFFKQGLSSSNMIPTDSVTADSPAELNFAVAGNLIVNLDGVDYQCEGVRFGQGSLSGGENNWWAGQPGAVKCGNSQAPSLNLNCANSGNNDESTVGLSQYSLESTHTFQIFRSPRLSC